MNLKLDLQLLQHSLENQIHYISKMWCTGRYTIQYETPFIIKADKFLELFLKMNISY